VETGNLGNPLLRFLDREAGPIIKLTTTSIQIEVEQYYSFASLSPKVTKSYRDKDILEFGGSAWSANRLLSQEKAITEAIERWAFKFYLDSNPEYASLHLDPTTNGFSAMPNEFGIEAAFYHSYCECIERYLTGEFADNNEKFNLKLIDYKSIENLLFLNFPGSLESYYCKIEIDNNKINFSKDSILYFVMSLFWIKDAGVVVGSSCSNNLMNSYQKSQQECYIHLLAANKFKNREVDLNSSITDKRLKNFAEKNELASLIKSRITQYSNSVLKPVIPEISFIKELSGPWNPEVNVVRVLLKNVKSLIEGDECRFLI
jgi:hypothetical protein